MKIVTHNGKFHADDVFAVAVIMLAHKGEDFEIVRTRDIEIIKTGDIVVDVGAEYDPKRKRFDHHQSEGAGVRKNGIPYSSFGIIWKEYGEKICGTSIVSKTIDENLVMPIDADDNGMTIQKNLIEGAYEYSIADVIDTFNASWNEEREHDEGFREAVEFAKKVLEREIIRAKAKEDARVIVEKVYASTEDKRVIVFENYMPWSESLSSHDEPLFVIYPNSNRDGWRVQATRNGHHSFIPRKMLPEAWGGKNFSELAEITGVSDAVFCHKNLHLCGAKTKEGAIKLAELALNT